MKLRDSSQFSTVMGRKKGVGMFAEIKKMDEKEQICNAVRIIHFRKAWKW